MTTLPYDYGPVDALADAPRYTTLTEVKARLGITTTAKDDAITQAIVAAEYAIDVHNGRSFPDGPGVPDETRPGPIQGIPEAVKAAALSASIAVFKEADAPTGTAGSDAFIGVIDVSDIARRVIGRSVILVGFRVPDSYGTA
jgi:hypothetical protein